mmetsp:Transcript_25913/g.89110  ORF Transcript_25913/g.89110 Transcript_25913/m.89110 type:complete len:275 (+) Transcript_25913:68-892(+)
MALLLLAGLCAAATALHDARAARRGPAATPRHVIPRRSWLSTAALMGLPLASHAEAFDEWKAEKERQRRSKENWLAMPATAPTDAESDAIGQRLGNSQRATSATVTVDASRGYGEPVWMIMRVQEATAQQARLVSTGKYKDVQRSNIKFATKLMLDNYKLFESVDRASRLAPPGKQAEAMEKGRSAAENLQTLLEYFDSSVDSLNVDTLDPKKQQFILKALDTTRMQLDEFLAFLPTDLVEAARALILEENGKNDAEYKEAENKAYLNPTPGGV